MRAPVSLGFRTPEDKRIRAGGWIIVTPGGQELESPESVPDWDYFMPLHIERDIEVDVGGVRADCGLDGRATVVGAVAWHSSWTNLRGCTPAIPIRDGVNTLSADLPGEVLGGRLTIESCLLLGTTIHQSPSLAPYRGGSTLWTDSLRVTLEGTGGRFPVLPLSFAASGVAGGRTGCWALVLETTDLSASGPGSLRLLLNTDHPAITLLLGAADSAEARWLHEFLRFDTTRQLLEFALANDQLVTDAAYDEGTLGELLASLLKRLFPYRDLESLRSDWRTAPGELQAELQARLRFLEHR
jgi:hypothetical protein